MKNECVPKLTYQRVVKLQRGAEMCCGLYFITLSVVQYLEGLFYIRCCLMMCDSDIKKSTFVLFGSLVTSLKGNKHGND